MFNAYDFREDVNEIPNNIEPPISREIGLQLHSVLKPNAVEIVKVNIKQSKLKNAEWGIFSLQDIPIDTYITFELCQDVHNIDVDKNLFSGTFNMYNEKFHGKKPIDYFLNDAGFNYDEPLRIYTPKKLQNINLKAIVLNNKVVCYKTLHDINADDELYRAYGKTYWSQFVHDIFTVETKNYPSATVDLILDSVTNGITIKNFSDNDLYYALKKSIINHEIEKAKTIYDNLRDKSVILRLNNFFTMFDIFDNYNDDNFEETLEFLIKLIPDIDNSIRYNGDQILMSRCSPSSKDDKKIKWLINRYPSYLENKYYKMYIKFYKNETPNNIEPIIAGEQNIEFVDLIINTCKNISSNDEYYNMFHGKDCSNEFHGDI